MENQRVIFEAIKSDDVKSFSEYAQKDKSILSLCCGRFPLLSLCYLYGARKIIKAYEKPLNASTYVYVAEEAGMYEDFKTKAQKSVRLYTGEDAVVSPLEMLAALDSPRISNTYPVLRKSETIKSNILKIYQSIHGREVTLTNESIIFPRLPLSRFKKTIIIAIVAVSLVFSSLPLASWALISNSYGKGTESNPYRISSSKQFEQMLNGESGEGKYYALKKNITINADFEAGDFAGILDGQDAAIYVNNRSTAVISMLNGTIKNINFVLNLDRGIAQSTSFIVSTNNGNIQNVNATFNAALRFSGGMETETACFAFTNNGTISNSTLNADAQFSALEESGGAFGGFAVYNYGTIQKCSVTQGSKLVSDTADVAGIVLKNASDGTLTDCVNNASISQTTSKDYWNPIAAGIVLENYYGIVRGSVNNGDIAVKALAQAVESDEAEGRIEVYAAGIAYVNLGLIEKCKNTANITAVSKSFYTYVGGIVAYNAMGYVNQCGSSGQISVSSDIDDAEIIELYCGGIAGYNGVYAVLINNSYYQIIGYASVYNSFSAMTFAGQNGNASFGGISGLWYSLYSSQHTNNYYVKESNISYGVGTYIHQNGSDRASQEFDGLKSVENLTALKATEVYW